MVRIAVVEDEAVSRQLLANYLARYSEENDVSFDVTYFEDGGAIIGGYKPVYDIILMDIQMTHVDGMTAARAIREVDQEVVLVFITSAAQFAIHGYQVGALSYLLLIPLLVLGVVLVGHILAHKHPSDSFYTHTARILEV